MDNTTSLDCVRRIVAEIFERDMESLSASTRLLQDLPCESIDLLEIAARVSQVVRRDVEDDSLFLRSLRPLVAESGADEPELVIAAACPWLSAARVHAIAGLLSDPAPFVTLGDMAAYLDHIRA